MNKDNIIKLVKQFNEINYKDLFGALIVFEQLDYLYNLEDFNDKDVEFLEKIFNKFMDSDICGLLNEDLKELIEEVEEYE